MLYAYGGLITVYSTLVLLIENTAVLYTPSDPYSVLLTSVDTFCRACHVVCTTHGLVVVVVSQKV